jgi:hypothetical protein
MDKIFFALWPHAGWPVALVITGVVIDFVSTDVLKTIVADKIKQSRPLEELQHTLRIFLDGFLTKLLARRIVSMRFLGKSALLSIVVLALIFFAQALAYYGSNAPRLLNVYISSGIGIALLLILTNIFVDYLANIVTVALVRMVASTGTLVDFVVAVCADVALTISIFTWVFPLGLVFSVYAFELSHPKAFMQIARPDQTPNWDRLALQDGKYVARAFEVLPAVLNAGNLANPRSLAVISRTEDDSVSKDVSAAASLLGSDSDQGRHLAFRDVATFEPSLEVEPFTFPAFDRLYAGAFSETNAIRNSFAEALSLVPISISLSRVYSAKEILLPVSEGLVLCSSNLKRSLVVDRRNLNDLLQKSKAACGEDFIAALTFLSGSSIQEELRKASSGEFQVPLAVFFLTSFTTCIAYYLVILFTVLGLAVWRVANRALSSKYVRGGEMPFTFLGLLLFIVVEPVWLVSLLGAGR